MTPRCVRVIFDIKHCLPGPVCSSLLFLAPSKILSTHRKLRNSYPCSSYITLLSVFLSSGMQHYKGYRKSIIYFTITSMIYGLISSLSFFQHPLFLDFFSKMLYKYSYSKTFYNTFPIQSGFVCCKLQYQRAFAG